MQFNPCNPCCGGGCSIGVFPSVNFWKNKNNGNFNNNPFSAASGIYAPMLVPPSSVMEDLIPIFNLDGSLSIIRGQTKQLNDFDLIIMLDMTQNFCFFGPTGTSGNLVPSGAFYMGQQLKGWIDSGQKRLVVAPNPTLSVNVGGHFIQQGVITTQALLRGLGSSLVIDSGVFYTASNFFGSFINDHYLYNDTVDILYNSAGNSLNTTNPAVVSVSGGIPLVSTSGIISEDPYLDFNGTKTWASIETKGNSEILVFGAEDWILNSWISPYGNYNLIGNLYYLTPPSGQPRTCSNSVPESIICKNQLPHYLKYNVSSNPYNEYLDFEDVVVAQFDIIPPGPNVSGVRACHYNSLNNPHITTSFAIKTNTNIVPILYNTVPFRFFCLNNSGVHTVNATWNSNYYTDVVGSPAIFYNLNVSGYFTQTQTIDFNNCSDPFNLTFSGPLLASSGLDPNTVVTVTLKDVSLDPDNFWIERMDTFDHFGENNWHQYPSGYPGQSDMIPCIGQSLGVTYLMRRTGNLLKSIPNGVYLTQQGTASPGISLTAEYFTHVAGGGVGIGEASGTYTIPNNLDRVRAISNFGSPGDIQVKPNCNKPVGDNFFVNFFPPTGVTSFILLPPTQKTVTIGGVYPGSFYNCYPRLLPKVLHATYNGGTIHGVSSNNPNDYIYNPTCNPLLAFNNDWKAVPGTTVPLCVTTFNNILGCGNNCGLGWYGNFLVYSGIWTLQDCNGGLNFGSGALYDSIGLSTYAPNACRFAPGFGICAFCQCFFGVCSCQPQGFWSDAQVLNCQAINQSFMIAQCAGPGFPIYSWTITE